MKGKWMFRTALVVACLLGLATGLGQAQGDRPEGGAAPEAAMGTAFTYQGRLKDGGSPATGTYDFLFELYDAASGGSQVGSTLTVDDVAVTEGLFTVRLNFGSGDFAGDARWLEIQVKEDSEGSYTLLSPRQELTPAPYALNTDLLDGQQASDFWNLTGNAGTSPGTDFLGTTDNQALELHVNGARALRLEPDATSPNVIGGYSGNWITSGVYGITIGGGGESGATNRVTDGFGTVSGGGHNQAGDNAGSTGDRSYATVSGGYYNTASGLEATVGGGVNNTASDDHATVGGGYQNAASDADATVGGGRSNTAGGLGSTVGGGRSNMASSNHATVSGGINNTASGFRATAGGGENNTAAGDYSFTAGRRAKANHQGAFVWADSTDADFASERNDQFRVRANGGARFDVNSGGWVNIYDDGTDLISTSSGARLTLTGIWTDTSDRNLKENLIPVDGQAVLAKLAELPITTWNYKAQNPDIRHLGPTAQDFYAAFGLGEDDKHIAALDTSGVALAAIQTLYEQTSELEAENATLQQQIGDLEARLAALEQAAGQSGGSQEKLPVAWLVMGGLVVVAGVVIQRRRPGEAG